MNNPAGMSNDELAGLMASLLTMKPTPGKDRSGSKPQFRRKDRRKKNRAARRSRARNRRR